MKKINIIFSSLLLAVSLLVTSVAQAKDIKIGVSFRMLSDVGYKHGEWKSWVPFDAQLDVLNAL